MYRFAFWAKRTSVPGYLKTVLICTTSEAHGLGRGKPVSPSGVRLSGTPVPQAGLFTCLANASCPCWLWVPVPSVMTFPFPLGPGLTLPIAPMCIGCCRCRRKQGFFELCQNCVGFCFICRMCLMCVILVVCVISSSLRVNLQDDYVAEHPSPHPPFKQRLPSLVGRQLMI